MGARNLAVRVPTEMEGENSQEKVSKLFFGKILLENIVEFRQW